MDFLRVNVHYPRYVCFNSTIVLSVLCCKSLFIAHALVYLGSHCSKKLEAERFVSKMDTRLFKKYSKILRLSNC